MIDEVVLQIPHAEDINMDEIKQIYLRAFKKANGDQIEAMFYIITDAFLFGYACRMDAEAVPSGMTS